MKAMILAAGRGKRMGSLTDDTPKPLLKVGNLTLLENKIRRLKAAGIDDIVINVAYLGEQICAFAGDGNRWQVNIQYSRESEPLETGGGINRALPLLGDKPFLAINADIWCDYPLQQLVNHTLPQSVYGHLVLVRNPSENPNGDLILTDNGLISHTGSGRQLTYSGIALYHPDFIRAYPRAREQFPLLEVFHYWMDRQQLGGEFFAGQWSDVGTPERLHTINHYV